MPFARLSEGEIQHLRLLLLRSWRGSSQGPEMGHSLRILSRSSEPRPLTTVSSPPTRRRRMRRRSLKVKDFLRVGVRERPAKSPKGIDRSLARCALPYSRMAKVELEGVFYKLPPYGVLGSSQHSLDPRPRVSDELPVSGPFPS